MTTKQQYKAWRDGFTTDHPAPRKALRVNHLAQPPRTTKDMLAEARVTTEKIPWLDHGYWYDAPHSLSSTAAYLHGAVYRQGAASQLPVQILSPDTGVILDMCAAPGSKTTQLAEATSGEATIIALDTSHDRLRALESNVERLGHDCIAAYKKDARFADDLNTVVDAVLLDAPCTGNYAHHDDYFRSVDEDDIHAMAQRQSRLLDAAYQVLRPGGTLVYSTCSLDPRENEEQIADALAYYDDLSLEPPRAGIGSPGLTVDGLTDEQAQKIVRLWPQATGTEGFVAAKLRKHQ